MKNKIRVILVDDHAVVRAGYKILLKNIDYIDVIAEADTGEKAIELSRKHRPDVIVMDISLPGINGIETTRRITLANSYIKILTRPIRIRKNINRLTYDQNFKPTEKTNKQELSYKYWIDKPLSFN